MKPAFARRPAFWVLIVIALWLTVMLCYQRFSLSAEEHAWAGCDIVRPIWNGDVEASTPELQKALSHLDRALRDSGPTDEWYLPAKMGRFEALLYLDPQRCRQELCDSVNTDRYVTAVVSPHQFAMAAWKMGDPELAEAIARCLLRAHGLNEEDVDATWAEIKEVATRS